MNENVDKAYTEVLEILKYVTKEEREKIPKEIIQIFEKYSDKNYKFNLDKTLPFENNELLDETKTILALLYRDYWATDAQRKQIKIKEKIEIDNINKEKSEKYKTEDLFKNRKKDIEKNQNDRENREIVVYEEKKWYKKFIQFIKKFINKEKQ